MGTLLLPVSTMFWQVLAVCSLLQQYALLPDESNLAHQLICVRCVMHADIDTTQSSLLTSTTNIEAEAGLVVQRVLFRKIEGTNFFCDCYSMRRSVFD